MLSLRDSRLSRRGCRPSLLYAGVVSRPTPTLLTVLLQLSQRASASKAKSSVLSELSGLENVVFNDFIDDELDSEDVSEQRASSLPDSVPIESEEERAAREAADEMAALDSVGDYEADPNVTLEDVPQDIVIKTLKVSCACVPVLVFACVCVYVRARDVDMCS